MANHDVDGIHCNGVLQRVASLNLIWDSQYVLSFMCLISLYYYFSVSPWLLYVRGAFSSQKHDCRASM